MIKVVIDTNVFISSFFGGNPRKIIDLWKTGEIYWCLSNAIIDEYIEVLRRMGLQNEDEISELLSLFAEGKFILFTTKTPRLNVVDDDPDDNKFIECAVALKAQYIITGDIHLKRIKKYMNIAIVSPKDFLKNIEAM
ncbi:MAG: putative toxin-antitoxin system toxin component, PIN family [Calditrichaeota bacterium]|nr:putative toxin-antitoxin system toxin component, PIN family [Calditrichota bacterium]